MRTIANNADGSIIIEAKIDRSQIPEEFAQLQKAIQKELENLQKTVDGLATNFEGLNKAAKDIETGLDGVKTEVEGVGKGFKDSEEKASGFRQKTTDAVTQVAQTMQSMRLQELVGAIADAFAECAQASIEFESAMTGVFKTINGTDEQLRTIEQGIRDMATDLPSTTTEIAGVAEAAGQLGVATEGILDFTEVMINLGEATNLTADEAASSLAKFANVTGMLEADYSRLGSVIVALGNTMATTEADIVAMGTRIASAGEQIGLTEDQIMGMAAALSSVGLEAEAGGTAISKLMIDMKASASMAGETAEILSETGMSVRELELLADTSASEFKALANELGYTSTELKNLVKQRGQLEKFAEIAGMTAEQFVDAFGKDAAKTMATFFEGLGSGSEDAITILNELGIEEVRLRDTMLRLTSASDLFARAQSTAASAWEDNIALVEEASKRYETTESKIAMLGNAFNDLKLSIGDVFSDSINDATGWLTDFTLAASEFVQNNPEVVKALGLVAGAIAGVGIAAGAAMAISALVSAFSGMGAVIGIISAAGAAIGAFITAIAIGDEVESVRELTTALREAKEGFEDADEVFETSMSNIKATSDVAGKYVEKLEALEEAGLGSAEAQAEYAQTVAKLNQLMPELNLTIDETTGKIQGSTEALRDQIDAWKEAAEAQAYYAAYQNKLDLLVAAELEVEVNKSKLAEAQAVYDKLESQGFEAKTWNVGQKMSVEEQAYVKQLNEQLKVIQNLEAALADSELALPDLQADVDTVLAAIEGYQQAATVAQSASQSIAEAVMSGAMTMEQAAELYNVPVQDIITALGELETAQQAADQAAAFDNAIANVQALAAAYETSLSAAAEQVDKQFSIIADLPAKLDTSFEQITQKLEAQTQYWEDYRKGLETLKAAGLSEDILGELASGSEESVSIVSALIEEIENLGGVDTEAVQSRIEEINGAFANLKTAEETVAQEMAAIQTQFDENLAAILESCEVKGAESGAALIESFKLAISESGEGISESALTAITTGLGLASTGSAESANSVGANIVAGITSGVYSGSGNLNSAMAAIIESAIQTAKDAAVIQSPSKRARDEVGVYIAEGVAVGIVENAPAIADAARHMIDDTIDSMSESIENDELADKFAAMFGANSEEVGQAIAEIYDGFNEFGKLLVQGFIDGFNDQLPAFQEAVLEFFAALQLTMSQNLVDNTYKITEDMEKAMDVFFPYLFTSVRAILEEGPKLIQDLTTTTKDIVVAAVEMMTAAIQPLYENDDMLFEAGAHMAEAIIKGFKENGDLIAEFINWIISIWVGELGSEKNRGLFSEAVGMMLGQTNSIIEANKDDLMAGGQLITESISAGVVAGLEEDDGVTNAFAEVMETLVGSANTVLEDQKDAFTELGKTMPEAFSSSLISSMNEIDAASIISGMLSELTSAAAAGGAEAGSAWASAFAAAASSAISSAQQTVAGGAASGGTNVTNNKNTNVTSNTTINTTSASPAEIRAIVEMNERDAARKALM